MKRGKLTGLAVTRSCLTWRKMISPALALVLGAGVSLGTIVYDTNSPATTTLAGSGISAYVDGVGTNASFRGPFCIAADSHGNLFVLDISRSGLTGVISSAAVRKIDLQGAVSTFAMLSNPICGNFACGGLGPSMAIDVNDTLWIANGDIGNGNRGLIFRVRSDQTVDTVWPPPGNSNPAMETMQVIGIACDAQGMVYVTTVSAPVGSQAGIWRRWCTNTFQGWTKFGTNLLFQPALGSYIGCVPGAIGADALNHIYFIDNRSNLLFKIDQAENTSILAGHVLGCCQDTNGDGQGTNACFGSNAVSQILYDSGTSNLYATEWWRIRKVDPNGLVDTVAGGYLCEAYGCGGGYFDSVGKFTRFGAALSACTVSDAIYVADYGNFRIRRIDYHAVGAPIPPPMLTISPYGGQFLQFRAENELLGAAYRAESSTDLQAWFPAPIGSSQSRYGDDPGFFGLPWSAFGYGTFAPVATTNQNFRAQFYRVSLVP